MNSVASRKWVIVTVATLMNFSSIFAMLSYPPVIPNVMKEFGLSYSEAGLLMSLPSVVGIFLSFPAGILVSRLGLKAVGSIGMLACTIGSFVSYVGISFLTIEVGRTLLGLGNVLVSIVAVSAIPAWFTKNDVGKAMGVKSLDNPAASVIALNLLPVLASAFQWRVSFLIPTIVLGLTTMLFFTFFKGRDMDRQQIHLRDALNRQIWLTGSVFAFFNMGMISFITWAGTFFIEMKGIPSDLSFFLASLAMLMLIPLGPVAGTLSDRFGGRILITASALVSSVSFLLVPYFAVPTLFFPVIALGIGNSFLVPSIFALQSKILPSGKAGIAFGVFSTCGSIGVTIGPYLVGLTRDVTSGSSPVFLLMSAFCFVSFFCALFIRVKDGKSRSIGIDQSTIKSVADEL